MAQAREYCTMRCIWGWMWLCHRPCWAQLASRWSEKAWQVHIFPSAQSPVSPHVIRTSHRHKCNLVLLLWWVCCQLSPGHHWRIAACCSWLMSGSAQQQLLGKSDGSLVQVAMIESPLLQRRVQRTEAHTS